jgi:hypothetical protein
MRLGRDELIRVSGPAWLTAGPEVGARAEVRYGV